MPAKDPIRIPVLNPSDLLLISKRCYGPITVRGVVQAIRPKEFATFGDLRMTGDPDAPGFEKGIIEFKLDPSTSISQGDEVQITGTFEPKNGLLITGVIERVIPTYHAETVERGWVSRAGGRMHLDDFIHKKGIHRLAVFATTAAWNDLSKDHFNDLEPQWIVKAIGTPSDLVKKIREHLFTDQYSGVVIAMGGDRSIAGLIGESEIVARALIESKKHFYLAIGHNDYFASLAYLADQPFHTPTDFANSLGVSMLSKIEREKSASDLAWATKEMDRAKGEFAKAAGLVQKAEALRNKRNWVLCLGAAAVALLFGIGIGIFI